MFGPSLVPSRVHAFESPSPERPVQAFESTSLETVHACESATAASEQFEVAQI